MPSKKGIFCTFVLLCILSIYTYYKVNIMLEKKAEDIVSAVIENEFDDTDQFGTEQGLNLAVGIASILDDSTWQQIDPSYGRIRFGMTNLTRDDNGEFRVRRDVLDSHVCTREELGLSGAKEESQFWPVKDD